MSDPESNFQSPPPPPLPPDEPKAPRPTRYRPFAIGIFVIGLITFGLGLARVMHWSTGIVLILFGIILFALSFVPLPVVSGEEGPIPFVQKLLGIFYEPSRIFRNLRAYPHWVGAFVLIVLLNGVYSFAFVRRITPERIVNHTVEKLADSPFKPPPDQMEQMRTDQLAGLKKPVEQVGTVLKSFVGTFVLVGIGAALTLLLVLAFGGRINFWQALAVGFWSWVPIAIISKGLSLILLYVKSPDDLHPILNQETLVTDNLGILVSPGANPVLFVLLSVIGLLSFYGLWLRATGLRNGGTKVGSTAAWGVAITFWFLLLLAGMGMAAVFGSFMS
jgi:hypothetical protein